jgi:hypothetical protein
MQARKRHPDNVGEKAESFVRQSHSAHQQIQVAAYYLAEHRGFAPGHELEDWVAAEREIERLIASYGAD